MRKKILIITDNEPTQINGVVTTFKNIESYADADGYDIVYLDPRQFHHVDAPGYSEVKLSWPRAIGAKIKAMEPDYIHIATEGPIGLAARVWLGFKGWKYNTSYHTKFPEFLKEIYNIPEYITWQYLIWFHKHSSCILTTTETMVKDLQAHSFINKIVSWTRGVNRDNLVPSQLWLHNNIKPVVLYVGRVSKEKNIEAVCKLSNQYNVVIVGDGPQRSVLESKYPKAYFVGYKTGTDLADWYSRANVFAFPSKTDTFGIVMIEAMSLGTPVAAYPVPGPIDVIELGTGYMSENLVDAIENCLRLPRDRVKELSSKWTWQNCWNTFKNNLVEII